MNPPKKDDAIVVTNPDPTVAVKEAVTLAIKNLEEKVDARFSANEDAVKLARQELKTELTLIKEGINEKFVANEKLVDQLAKANQVALTAALQTQKESAAKSELSMADLLKQLQVSFETANKATNEKIDRLTSRLDTGEGRTGGADNNRQVSRQDVQESRQSADSTRNLIFGLISVVLVATGIIVAVLLRK